MIKTIIMMLLILTVYCCYTYLVNRSTVESMVNVSPIDPHTQIKWKRDKNCKYEMSQTIKEVLQNNRVTETKGDDWIIYMPCTYNDITAEIKNMKPISNDQRFFIVNNADQLTGKNAVWSNLVKSYGREEASKIMPTTYLLNSESDVNLLKQQHTLNPNKIYILKKNIQRQQGLKITKDINEIINGKNSSFVVAQELLQDPYLINRRKINMRFYVLFVCRHNEVSAYVHKEGFMYYTKEFFKTGSTEDGPNITTGYIERKVYDENPLTHGDFRKYLDDPARTLSVPEAEILRSGNTISDVAFGRTYYMLKKVVDAVSKTVCIDSKLRNFVTFQLFGVDVAHNNKLVPQLIEVNKGPDLGSKDSRDGVIKHKVVSDIFRVIKTLNGSHDFLKIVDTP